MNEINMLLTALGSSTVLAILVVLGVINRDIITDIRECRRIYKDLHSGRYEYKGHLGEQIWFSRIDETNESYQYNEIIFFADGSIRLRENYYIHKGLLTFTLVQRYYYRKFHRSKDFYVNQYKTMQEYGRVSGVLVRNHSTNSKEISSFKFFRG